MRLKALLLIGLFAMPLACGRQTPEDEIRALITRMADAAEDEKVRRLSAGISDRYQDLRGNDKDSVIKILRLFMLRTDNVLVFEDIKSVQLITDRLASAEVDVRFAGANLELFSIRTAAYAFVLELERADERWQVVSARWAEASETPR